MSQPADGLAHSSYNVCFRAPRQGQKRRGWLHLIP